MRDLASIEGNCPFCKKVADGFHDDRDILVFEPLNPVTPGHLLVVPAQHVRDITSDPKTTARVFHRAAQVVYELRQMEWAEWLRDGVDIINKERTDYNVITSSGPFATQTVFHLHVHIVPRRKDDGLALPWTEQKSNEALEMALSMAVNVYDGGPFDRGVHALYREVQEARDDPEDYIKRRNTPQVGQDGLD